LEAMKALPPLIWSISSIVLGVWLLDIPGSKDMERI
jgi:hypothetical protein